jgi:hypothetical protein
MTVLCAWACRLPTIVGSRHLPRSWAVGQAILPTAIRWLRWVRPRKDDIDRHKQHADKEYHLTLTNPVPRKNGTVAEEPALVEPPPTEALRRRQRAERRASARHTLVRSTCAAVVSTAGVEAARVINMSSSGMAVLLTNRLDLGTSLVVFIEDCPNGLPVRVVHATAQAEGEWLIGCELTRGLSTRELHALLRHRPEG